MKYRKLTEEELEEAIKPVQVANTVKAQEQWGKQFLLFLKDTEEHSDPLTMEREQLVKSICSFFLQLLTVNGKEYKGGSV
jgi:hypothetical protein